MTMPGTVIASEGGDQGDPLMPALYALAQHPAFGVAATVAFAPAAQPTQTYSD